MKCAVALVLLAGSPAYADWNVGVYLGIPYTLSSPLRLQLSPGTDVVFESVAYRGEPFTFPLYYGYRAGYFSNHLGIEADHAEIEAVEVFLGEAREMDAQVG